MKQIYKDSWTWKDSEGDDVICGVIPPEDHTDNADDAVKALIRDYNAESTKQPVYKQPFRAEVEDITALVQSLRPIDELLAIKEELGTGECMHYSPAEISQLKKDVDQAYNSMPVRARPYIMNEMLSLWVQLSYL